MSGTRQTSMFVLPLALKVLLAGLETFISRRRSLADYWSSTATKTRRSIVGGFVPGIIFNQAEPGLVYARTDIGGACLSRPMANDGFR